MMTEESQKIRFLAGYENADWFIPAPALRLEDADLKLSPDQIRETLNYFSEYNLSIFPSMFINFFVD
jgi:hypothetical protein